MSLPFLSIIIPAFNEAHRLPSTLLQAHNFLCQQPYPYEVLVVENGSSDGTFQIAKEFSALHPNFYALQEAARGKGRAVRKGMLQARGEYRFMCDADFSMPIAEVNRFFPPALTDFDLAIATREAQDSVRYDEPLYRHLGGRLINVMIRFLVLPGLHDTQCGFKCFHHSIVEDLFDHQTLMGWSFDIELLYIARRRGYRIREIPIPWYFNPESKLNVVRDALRMGIDILAIHYNTMRGVYDDSPSRA